MMGLRGMAVVVVMAACSHAPPPSAPAPVKKVKLAVLPVESDAFPGTAHAATEMLTAAHITGVDETAVSKVSLEVVQLSIECVEATPACYEAVGHSLSANELLFAQITSGAKRKQVKVKVTLFDVDGKAAKATAEHEFANESEAGTKLADLVAEVTKP